MIIPPAKQEVEGLGRRRVRARRRRFRRRVRPCRARAEQGARRHGRGAANELAP
jgi:hypothetical protein